MHVKHVRYYHSNGFRGLPVSRDTLRQVYHLLEEIPTDITAPSLSAHPDGAIAMEWYLSKNRQIVLSVVDGEIHYAAKFGANRHHGSFAIVDGWPIEKSAQLMLAQNIADGCRYFATDG